MSFKRKRTKQQSREDQHPLAVDTALLFEKPEDGKIAYLKSQKKRRHLQPELQPL
jgi:hypothetical protein